MPSFLFYTKPGNVRRLVRFLASDQFGKVSAGDELWSVTSEDGALILEAHIEVSSVIGKAQAAKQFGKNLWDAKFYAVAASPSVRPAVDIPRSQRTCDLKAPSIGSHPSGPDSIFRRCDG